MAPLSTFDLNVPSSPTTPTTPSKAGPVQESHSQASPHLKLEFQSHQPFLPHDILHLIITEHLAVPDNDGNTDLATLNAFSQCNKLYLNICRKILFRIATFNLRRKDFLPRVELFCQTIQDYPHLADYIKVLRVADHTLTESMRVNEALLPFAEPADGREYFHHFQMTCKKQRALLRRELPVSAQFATAIAKLTRLEELDVSFFYVCPEWQGLSRSFRRALCSAIAYQERLATLRLEGIANVPADLLKRFRSLRALSLRNVSVSPSLDTTTSRAIGDARHRRPWTVPSDAQPPALSSLSIRNVPLPGAQALFDFWRTTFDTPGFADMAHPTQLQAVFDDPAHVAAPAQLLADMLPGARHLALHTMGLGVGAGLPVQVMGGPGGVLELDAVDHPALWLGAEPDAPALLSAQDARAAGALETLALSVSFWDARVCEGYGRGQENAELAWALSVLRAVRAEGVRAVVLRVKVGGYPEESVDALEDFCAEQRREQGGLWEQWVEELGRERWRNLGAFDVHILAPGIGANEADVERIARAKLSALFASKTGRLSIRLSDITDSGPVYLG